MKKGEKPVKEVDRKLEICLTNGFRQLLLLNRNDKANKLS